MTLNIEEFTMTDGKTSLSAAELNARWYAIVRRLHTLELLSLDWATAISELRNYGLARINDAVLPLINSLKTDLTDLIAQGQADLASQSAAVDAKLAEVDTTMTGVDAKIAAVEALVNDVNTRIAAVEAVQATVGAQITSAAKRLTIIFGG
jgi:septal ring factor EnvC (AmiA/AmiB activator)